ncbi:hypothetical protein E1I69_21555 [Bacillus timonensis]|uniref:Pre-toxin TG domain-containing protein n=2 Tax=Bacillus timonensis TaxID=1033734 RepID=A0A4S3PLY3_9BACI|nr:hypothetical protein E1I69_21555 [Bacillus timonensis]
MSGKVGEFLLELVGWYDIQRVFSEYDPVTGEKLSAGDRVLAVGFLALTFVPPAKAVGVGGKAAVPGVKAGLPSLAKTPEAFMKIRNVLDPEKVQQAFRSVYNEVVKGPIAATKVWFDKIKKGIGDIPIPQIRQEAFAGVGVVNKTVRDAFGDAKDFIQRIKSSQVDEVEVKGVTGVEGVTKGTKEVKMTSSGNSKHSRDVNIPSVRNNEFNEWFDNLPAKEFEEMWNDPKLRIKIEDRIRQPGGYHEWHLVARTPKFKQWGISMDDIKEMRSLTKDVEFVNPPGRHGSRGSTKAHNEILKIIDNASDYESFVKGLNEWSKNRMKNGIMDLPEGLRR